MNSILRPGRHPAAFAAVLVLLAGLPPAVRAFGPPVGCGPEAGPPGGHGPAMSHREDMPRSHHPAGDAPAPWMDPVPPHLRGLGLDDGQRDKVFSLYYEQMPRRREQWRVAARARLELRRLVAASEFDPGRARTLAEAHGRAVAALVLMEAELDARVRLVLTPEQRLALDRRHARWAGEGDRP